MAGSTMDWYLVQRIAALLMGLVFLGFGIFILLIAFSPVRHGRFLAWRVEGMEVNIRLRWYHLIFGLILYILIYGTMHLASMEKPEIVFQVVRLRTLFYTLGMFIFVLIDRWIPGPKTETELWLKSARKPLSLFALALYCVAAFLGSAYCFAGALLGADQMKSATAWMESGTFVTVLFGVFGLWTLFRFFRWAKGDYDELQG